MLKAGTPNAPTETWDGRFLCKQDSKISTFFKWHKLTEITRYQKARKVKRILGTVSWGGGGLRCENGSKLKQVWNTENCIQMNVNATQEAFKKSI